MKFEWEKINDDNSEMTHRVKVIGGWIVKNWEWEGGDSPSVSMVFIYDPTHEWTIEE